MIKRPLVWVLAVWILGEIAATRFGYSLAPKTELDMLIGELGQIKTEAEGTVVEIQKKDYGLSLVLDDVYVQIPDSVRFSSEDKFAPKWSEIDSRNGREQGEPWMRTAAWPRERAETQYMMQMPESGTLQETVDYIRTGCRVRVLSDELALHIGNRVRVSGKLSEIEEATNPGQFDSRSWYRSRGIGFFINASEVYVTDSRKAAVSDGIRILRERLSDNLQRVSSGADYGLFCAVLLGDKTGLSEESNDLFRRGGIAHILAVSGMHVSILGAGLFWLLRKAPVQAWIPPLCASAFMLGFVVLTGASSSAIRAAVMFMAMMAARLTGKSYDSLSAAALAALIMLFIYPELLSQAGFQLSFASAFSIHVLAAEAGSWVKPKDYVSRGLLISVCVSMGIMPLLAWHYYQVSVTGIFVNLIASLLTSMLLLSSCAAALLPFLSDACGVFFAGTGHYIRIILEGLCRMNDRLPGSTLTTGRPALWLVVTSELLLLCVALWMRKESRRELFAGRTGPKGEQGRARGDEKKDKSGRRMLLISAAYCLMLLIFTPHAHKGLDIACLDIGQGDCSVVRIDDEVWMIDAGSSSIDGIWTYRIKPYLLYEAIDRVDVVALTHPDDDHINAIYDMLLDESVTVGRFLIPEASYGDPSWDMLKIAAAEHGVRISVAAAGEEYQVGKGLVRCLYPEASAYSEDTNALSMVLELCYGSFRGLFMGDLGEEEEPDVLSGLLSAEDAQSTQNRQSTQNGQSTQSTRGLDEILADESASYGTMAYGVTVRITFLKAGHHGSKYSSSEHFVRVIRPVFASISCGRNNRYGHPSEEALSRLEDVGTIYRVTAWSGAVLLELDGDVVALRGYLDE